MDASFLISFTSIKGYIDNVSSAIYDVVKPSSLGISEWKATFPFLSKASRATIPTWAADRNIAHPPSASRARWRSIGRYATCANSTDALKGATAILLTSMLAFSSGTADFYFLYGGLGAVAGVVACTAQIDIGTVMHRFKWKTLAQFLASVFGIAWYAISVHSGGPQWDSVRFNLGLGCIQFSVLLFTRFWAFVRNDDPFAPFCAMVMFIATVNVPISMQSAGSFGTINAFAESA